MESTVLKPYIFLYGRCEEALEFYKKAFGGTYELMRVSDTPMAEQMGKEAANLVMHASFTSGPITFFCSDGREVKKVDPDAGNISVAITAADFAEGQRYFAALSEGGTVGMPLSPAFWGGQFGMLVDRFGTEWLITTP